MRSRLMRLLLASLLGLALALGAGWAAGGSTQPALVAGDPGNGSGGGG